MKSKRGESSMFFGIIVIIAILFIVSWVWPKIFPSYQYVKTTIPNSLSAGSIIFDQKFSSMQQCVDTIRNFSDYYSRGIECGKNCRYEGEEYLGLVICDETSK